MCGLGGRVVDSDSNGQSQRTSWGVPDLQGVWTNSTRTPFERPESLADRDRLTPEEVAALEASVAGSWDRPPPPGDPGAYNEFWREPGFFLERTSLIVDPPNGRLPALTEDGARRAAWQRGGDSWVNRNLSERCLTRGAPRRPGSYNNNFLILQTPGYVVILQEMIHEVRIIAIDDRPRIDEGIRLFLGDARGHWEGDTLVVETTHFRDDIIANLFNCCPGAGRNLRVIERFTQVDVDTIEHRYTVEDPTTYTRPFTVSLPMTRIEGPIFEYACHEGNLGMEGILAGARAEELRDSVLRFTITATHRPPRHSASLLPPCDSGASAPEYVTVIVKRSTETVSPPLPPGREPAYSFARSPPRMFVMV